MTSLFNCCFKEASVSAILSSTGKSKKVIKDSNYYDFLAPSVFHLISFLEEIEAAGLGCATLYEIENLKDENPGLIRKKGLEVECPIDGKVGSAYVHAIQSLGEDHVGTATHMLSYTWGYKIADIVETVSQFCKDNGLDPKRTYVWICAFCNNQHRVRDRVVPFEEFQEVFQRRVKGIGKVLAMMAPWNDPGYLKRVWCIFEMYSAYADDECSVQIIMPPKEKESLLSAVSRATDSSGRSGLDELTNALANTKVENADSSQQSDKDNIIRLVEEGPGCYELNVEINQLLRTWFRETVFDAVKTAEAKLVDARDDSQKKEIATLLSFYGSYFSESGKHDDSLMMHSKAMDIYKMLDQDDADTKELVARMYNNMGTECESLGQYEKALEMHLKCREAFEEIYGEDHENTSTSYFNIGVVYKRLGRDDEALEMHKKSLEIDKMIKGENHIDVALGYSYIGRIHQGKEEYDKALEMYEKSMEIRKKVKGPNSPDVAIGYADLGLLCHMKGDYDSAIEYHTKARLISEAILGRNHADTASSYQNIGGAYYEKKEYDKALEYVEKAYSAYLASFGPDHPKTKTAEQWVSLVKEAMQ